MEAMKSMPRPPAVTMACLFVAGSSFLMLIALVQALSNWGTIEMQEALRPTLTRLHDQGVDVGMAELLDVLHWIGLGGVLLLVAGMVFAIYAFRGDQFSRIGTTVLAVILGVLVVSLGAFGILQAVFLLVAAVTLWTPDARQWFASRRGAVEGAAPAERPAPAESEPSAGAWPAPQPGTAASVVETPTPTVRATRRPGAVLAAGLVTVIGSALAGGFAGLYVLIYSVARDDYVQMVKDGPFADWYSPGELDDALRIAFWACLVILPLALAGLAAGISLLARLRVGRAATLALSWITAAVGVVLIPFGLLGTGAAVAVIVLLNRDESRAWTAGAR